MPSRICFKNFNSDYMFWCIFCYSNAKDYRYKKSGLIFNDYSLDVPSLQGGEISFHYWQKKIFWLLCKKSKIRHCNVTVVSLRSPIEMSQWFGMVTSVTTSSASIFCRCSLYIRKICMGTVRGACIIGVAFSLRVIWYLCFGNLPSLSKQFPYCFSTVSFDKFPSWAVSCTLVAVGVVEDLVTSFNFLNLVETDLSLYETLNVVVSRLVNCWPPYPFRPTAQGCI